MISINSLRSYIKKVVDLVNAELQEADPFDFRNGMWVLSENGEETFGKKDGRKIDHTLFAATESHLMNLINGKSGLVLAIKLPDSDSEIDTIDNYSENNHMLVFVIEKISAGQLSNEVELDHLGKCQHIMSLFKEFFLESGMNDWELKINEDATLQKGFRTEWEYNVYGGFNGISANFDLKDFSL